MWDLFMYLNWLFDFSFSQNLISQVVLVYILFLLIRSNNIFYSLMYLFILLICFGIFVAFYQMELYTGFLWVAEFSIILVFLILLIYLNTDGYSKYYSMYSSSKLFFFLIFLMPILLSTKLNLLHLSNDFLLDFASLWDNYYEALSNTSINDFNGLFNSYYIFNSLEFLFFAFLLLFGTFVCVTIFKSFFVIKTIPYSNFFSIFNFFSIKLNYNFLRQQNVHKQTTATASNRVIKKK